MFEVITILGDTTIDVFHVQLTCHPLMVNNDIPSMTP